MGLGFQHASTIHA